MANTNGYSQGSDDYAAVPSMVERARIARAQALRMPGDPAIRPAMVAASQSAAASVPWVGPTETRHAPMTGTHTHDHSQGDASDGDDGVHSHMHTHNGDADHHGHRHP